MKSNAVVTLIAIDLAKEVFQLCCADHAYRPAQSLLRSPVSHLAGTATRQQA